MRDMSESVVLLLHESQTHKYAIRTGFLKLPYQKQRF